MVHEHSSAADYDRFLEVAVIAAKAAGNVIASAFHHDKVVEAKKNSVDLVTETDQKCEHIIKEILKREFPEHLFIGEENTAAQGFESSLTDEPTWMCDPLDGTTNFVHSFPFVCVSIALVIRQQVVAGVVYNPVLNELFTATRGGGAHLNGNPIHVSSTEQVGKALLATELGTGREQETMDAVFDRIRSLTNCMRSVRCCGSCAMNLCGVACGRLDAFYEIGFGGCWDVAAGSLIVAEAGGSVLDPAGQAFGLMARRVLASNGHLGSEIAKVLAACKTSPHEPAPPASSA